MIHCKAKLTITTGKMIMMLQYSLLLMTIMMMMMMMTMMMTSVMMVVMLYNTGQEFSVTLYLRCIWTDDRLAFFSRGNRDVTLNHRQFDRMWTPDVFVRNLKAGVFHTITVPNRLIRLSPDGKILYSQRLTLTLACDMAFSNYPMDNQTCMIELGSCKLRFAWINGF